MFKIEFNEGGRTMTFEFSFNTLWAASLKAREICNTYNVSAHVFDARNGVYVAHYWAD